MRQGEDFPVLPVQHWAGPGSLSAGALRTEAAPLVLGIATPDTPIRERARELARSALREALGVLLDRSPHEVPLISRPGQPLALDLPAARIGLSVSHEPGLSLAAIHMGGAVGVDLMRIGGGQDWLQDWEAVARDYLGASAAARIGGLPSAARAGAFARAWTRLEAGLKCHGMQLQEWSPALERKLASCRMYALELPAGLVGTLAVPG